MEIKTHFSNVLGKIGYAFTLGALALILWGGL